MAPVQEAPLTAPHLQELSDSSRPGLVSRLVTTCLPGRLANRAPAAAGLPTWLTILIGVTCFALSAELIAYTYNVATAFLQVIYSHWERAFEIPRGAVWVFLEVAAQHVQPRVLVDPTGNPGFLTTTLLGLACLAALLESINLVMLAPFAASYGQSLAHAGWQTRRILFSLGGLWLLEYSILWVLLFLVAAAVALYSCQTLSLQVAYTTLDDMIHLGFGAVLMLVLLSWLVRLVRAASYLPDAPQTPLPDRCSQCGYLLQGLAAGSGCPDCGQSDPAGPDRTRQPSPWLNRRHLGRLRALSHVSSQVARSPGPFFAALRVLCSHREALRFVRWNLWLCVLVWVMAVPGISAAMIEPNEFVVVNRIVSAGFMAALLGLMLALTGLLLLGLLISLTGFATGVVREEPAWPIAAEAGCYLSAWLPRISAGQALWVTGLFTAEQLLERGMFLRLARHAWVQTGIPWEIILTTIFALPMLLGLVLMVRTAVVCYRRVRYACR